MSVYYNGLLKALTLTYERGDGVSRLTCEIRLEDCRDRTKSTTLRFFGVQEMELREWRLGISLVELSIVDISDRQLEELRYEVYDEHEGIIGFSARSFEVS